MRLLHISLLLLFLISAQAQNLTAEYEPLNPNPFEGLKEPIHIAIFPTTSDGKLEEEIYNALVANPEILKRYVIFPVSALKLLGIVNYDLEHVSFQSQSISIRNAIKFIPNTNEILIKLIVKNKQSERQKVFEYSLPAKSKFGNIIELLKKLVSPHQNNNDYTEDAGSLYTTNSYKVPRVVGKKLYEAISTLKRIGFSNIKVEKNNSISLSEKRNESNIYSYYVPQKINHSSLLQSTMVVSQSPEPGTILSTETQIILYSR